MTHLRLTVCRSLLRLAASLDRLRFTIHYSPFTVSP